MNWSDPLIKEAWKSFYDINFKHYKPMVDNHSEIYHAIFLFLFDRIDQMIAATERGHSALQGIVEELCQTFGQAEGKPGEYFDSDRFGTPVDFKSDAQSRKVIGAMVREIMTVHGYEKDHDATTKWLPKKLREACGFQTASMYRKRIGGRETLDNNSRAINAADAGDLQNALQGIRKPLEALIATFEKASPPDKKRLSKDVLAVHKELDEMLDQVRWAVYSLFDKDDIEDNLLGLAMLGDMSLQYDCSLEYLEKALESPDPDLRLQATRSIYEIGIPAHPLLAQLIKAMEDPVARVRESVGQAISSMGPMAETEMADILLDGSEVQKLAALRIIDDMGVYGLGAAPVILGLLEHPHPTIVYESLAVLINQQPHINISADQCQVVSRLLEGNSDERIRMQAARFLGNTAPSFGQESVLLNALRNDSSDEVRAACAEALGRLGLLQEDIQDVLMLLVHSEHLNIASACIKSLYALNDHNPEISTLIREKILSGQESIRSAFIEVLAAMPLVLQKMVPDLASIYEQLEIEERNAVVAALTQISKVPGAALILAKGMQDSDYGVRLNALEQVPAFAPLSAELKVILVEIESRPQESYRIKRKAQMLLRASLKDGADEIPF